MARGFAGLAERMMGAPERAARQGARTERRRSPEQPQTAPGLQAQQPTMGMPSPFPPGLSLLSGRFQAPARTILPREILAGAGASQPVPSQAPPASEAPGLSVAPQMGQSGVTRAVRGRRRGFLLA